MQWKQYRKQNGESKPERRSRVPVKTEYSVSGPQNVSVAPERSFRGS